LKQIIRDCLSVFHEKENKLMEEKVNQEPIKYLHGLKELSEFLGCSVVTAQKIKNSGKIRYRQFERTLLFVTHEILEDLKHYPKPVRKVRRQN
jgi:hypothetical protein